MIQARELDIKLSYQCNNACVFCLNKEKKVFKDLSLENLKKQIKDFADKNGEKLIVSGGEPLINKNFFEIMTFAKANGIKVFEIQTNGRMLYYKKIVEFLEKFQPIGFLISLHYPDDKLYKKYCRSEGFKQTIAGIKNVTDLGLPVTINTVIHKQNYRYLEDILELLKKLKVKNWQYRFIDGKNVIDEYTDFVPTYSQCAPWIRKILKKERDIIIQLREFPLCLVGEEMLTFLSNPFLDTRLNLTSNNSLIPTKNIIDQQFVLPKKCRKCLYRNSCYGVRKEYLQFYGDEEIKPFFKKRNLFFEEKQYLAKFIKKDGSFLDYGCDNGALLKNIQQYIKKEIEPWGIDIDEEKIILAKKLFKKQRNNFLSLSLDKLNKKNSQHQENKKFFFRRQVREVRKFLADKKFDYIHWNIWHFNIREIIKRENNRTITKNDLVNRMIIFLKTLLKKDGRLIVSVDPDKKDINSLKYNKDFEKIFKRKYARQIEKFLTSKNGRMFAFSFKKSQ